MVGCIYRHFKGISIHASAKEATTVSSFSGVTEYFNPRLREGGDLSKDNLHLHHSLLFQSTPPRRRRLPLVGAYEYLAMISIHASAKEATQRKSQTSRRNYFNPRLREGGDRLHTNIFAGINEFQSTPPRRRRLGAKSLKAAKTFNFNPRLREGGDIERQSEIYNILISIHASAKEATAVTYV